jgi:hypothetical protein
MSGLDNAPVSVNDYTANEIGFNAGVPVAQQQRGRHPPNRGLT